MSAVDYRFGVAVTLLRMVPYYKNDARAEMWNAARDAFLKDVNEGRMPRFQISEAADALLPTLFSSDRAHRLIAELLRKEAARLREFASDASQPVDDRVTATIDAEFAAFVLRSIGEPTESEGR
jgi:hypothetical protein